MTRPRCSRCTRTRRHRGQGHVVCFGGYSRPKTCPRGHISGCSSLYHPDFDPAILGYSPVWPLRQGQGQSFKAKAKSPSPRGQGHVVCFHGYWSRRTCPGGHISDCTCLYHPEFDPVILGQAIQSYLEKIMARKAQAAAARNIEQRRTSSENLIVAEEATSTDDADCQSRSGGRDSPRSSSQMERALSFVMRYLCARAWRQTAT